MPRLRKKEVDRLGTRLRDAQVPAAEDLELLDSHLAAFGSPLGRVRDRLVRLFPGASITAREQKTWQSIAAKLRRGSGSTLSTLDDLAGVRVVVRGGRRGQDEAVDIIRTSFNVHRIKDRRVTPSHGYRAVHVIVREDNCRLEIQVRSELQNQWAQLTERLAVTFGRGIQYGEPPAQADSLLAGGATTRSEVVSELMHLSEVIHEAEQAEAQLVSMQSSTGKGDASERERFANELQRRQESVERAMKDLDSLIQALGQALT